MIDSRLSRIRASAVGRIAGPQPVTGGSRKIVPPGQEVGCAARESAIDLCLVRRRENGAPHVQMRTVHV